MLERWRITHTYMGIYAAHHPYINQHTHICLTGGASPNAAVDGNWRSRRCAQHARPDPLMPGKPHYHSAGKTHTLDGFSFLQEQRNKLRSSPKNMGARWNVGMLEHAPKKHGSMLDQARLLQG